RGQWAGADVNPFALGRRDEPGGAHDRHDRVRDEQADQESAQRNDPSQLAFGPNCACDYERLRARFSADAVDRADANRSANAVLPDFVYVLMRVPEKPLTQSAPQIAHARKDQHPAAAQPEIALAAEVAIQ